MALGGTGRRAVTVAPWHGCPEEREHTPFLGQSLRARVDPIIVELEQMLTSFSVTNYRSFVKPTLIELRPLTLLFGYNNAGKSALLQALPLMGESILEPRRGPLKLGTAASRDGAFDDLLTRLRPGAGLGLGLSWPRHSFELEIRHLPDRYRQIVSEMRIGSGNRRLEGRWIAEESPTGGIGHRYDITEGDSVVQLPVRFNGLVPDLEAGGGHHRKLKRIFTDLGSEIHETASGIHWLASLRSSPPRSFEPREPPSRLQPNGDGFTDVLFFDRRIAREGIFEEVAAWFETEFGQVLAVQSRAERSYLSLDPVDAAGLGIPLTDTGEGMVQVLPVLVALAMTRRAAAEHPQILALEQPELHLHPAAELALARRLADTAAGPNPLSIIIETHSENLLLSIQLQVAQGRLAAETVAIYWVERLNDGSSRARKIEIDGDGRTEGWPVGVFSEDIELARDLFLLRRKRRQP